MSRFRNIMMAGALALATVVPTLASAGPVTNPPLQIEKDPDVSNVRCDERCRTISRSEFGRSDWRGTVFDRSKSRNREWRRSDWRDHRVDRDRRVYRERRDYRWRDRYYRPRYERPRIYVAPSIYVAPRVIVRNSSNAHVRWCLRRYASYSPRTDTFLSYDGYRKRCISPYY